MNPSRRPAKRTGPASGGGAPRPKSAPAPVPRRHAPTADAGGEALRHLSAQVRNRLLLRPDEAARFVGVSRWTIYRWVEEGRLEACKLGPNTLRIFTRSLLSLVDHSRTRGMISGSPGSSGARRDPS